MVSKDSRPRKVGFSFSTTREFHVFTGMLNITRNATTRVAVTLKEKQTLSSPYWLWRFVNDATNIETVQIITEVANNYKDRSNLFDIEEGGFSTLSLPSGIYTYYVYEQSSSNNTDYTHATTLCEVGQMKVVGTDTHQYTSPQVTVEYKWTSQ